MRRLPCYMCKKRKAKPLTAKRDGMVYVNAEKVVMFCSVACAANYALLWGVQSINASQHYCSATGEWEELPACECDEC